MLPVRFLRRRPYTEAAPHFVYPIRDNPLNHKNSFLLSAFFVTHSAPACTNCFMILKKRLMYLDGRRFTGNAAFENCRLCPLMDNTFIHALLRKGNHHESDE
jgi:hypothetical protein